MSVQTDRPSWLWTRDEQMAKAAELAQEASVMLARAESIFERLQGARLRELTDARSQSYKAARILSDSWGRTEG